MNVADIPVFQASSPAARDISNLFILVLVVCGVILAIVASLITISLIRFREPSGGGEPTPRFGNRKLEIAWTVGPLLIVAWLFVLTARGMSQTDPPADREPDVIVTGHQWWWEVRYPQSGVVTANEIHLPTGKKFLVRLLSADVIHNFWVAQLSRKIQLVPGQTNHLWLEAETPGTYGGVCAEYCGVQHSWMQFSVKAETPEAFNAWLADQQQSAAAPATDKAQAGLKIFQAMTCVNCHAIQGVSTITGAAPDLTHLADREILGAGVLTNTETNLFSWLKNPQAIKPGCFMPDLKLTDEQAGALTAYLGGLK